MATEIAFDGDHKIKVSETPDEVVRALRDASSETPPLARLTTTAQNGPRFFLVNASLVRAIRETSA